MCVLEVIDKGTGQEFVLGTAGPSPWRGALGRRYTHQCCHETKMQQTDDV